MDNTSNGVILKIVYVSVQSTDASSMRAPVEEVCSQNGWELEMFCANDSDVDADPLTYHELVRRVLSADLVLVRCMSDPTRMRRFVDLERMLPSCPGYVMVHSGNAEVGLMYRDLFRGDDSEYATLLSYVRGRGAENDRAIAMWLHRALTGEGDLPEPIVHRSDGIHHRGMDRDITPEEYLAGLDPSKPTVGLMYTSNLWVYDNQEHIDALVDELESQGLNVIPVFFRATVASEGDSHGTAAVVRRYFMDGDRPMVDVILMVSPFSQLNNSRDITGVRTPDDQNFFSTMTDVPVLQVMSFTSHYADYEEVSSGASEREYRSSLVWPELDGQIVTVPAGSSEGGRGGAKRYSPIPDRMRHLARSARGWAELRRRPRSERRVAVLLYQSRQDSGRIGSAAGLDTIASVRDLLERLDHEGYTVDHIPADPRSLADELVSGVTNDLERVPMGLAAERAADSFGTDLYSGWAESVPAFDMDRMVERWGEPPGDVGVDDGRFVIPGVVNGNVFIGFQPMRALAEDSEAVYHDPVVPIPHQYLAFYRWLRDVFRADAVVHVGTHGTLEWLPGRSIALSGKCFPDLVLDGLPNIYPYIIDDPGEGIQAKRRSEAVLIGHMCPTMARAGSYDQISAIDRPLQEFFKSRTAKGEQRTALLNEVLDAVRDAGMLEELGIPEDVTAEGFEGYVERVHDHICDITDAMVRDGLHVLGRPPEGERLEEAVYTLTRLRNGDVPSLRSAVAESMGCDLGPVMDNPSGETDGELNSSFLERVDGETRALISRMQAAGYDADACLSMIPAGAVGLREAVGFVCGELVPNLLRMGEEMDGLLHALDGGYVLPGPSGAPTRGCAHILPMGRNYYGVDPDIVPTRAAWEVGRRMADQMVERYVSEKGEYPREIGFIIWATDTMKTNGDDVAYILWLMGVRLVWSGSSGVVTGVEPVPLEELGRPRLDVTVRITGLFRDVFPNLIDLLDDAARLVSGLDESDEDNAMAANLRRDIIEGMASGLTVDEARRRGSVRIFGCPPGGYGPGVNHAIESGDWKTVQDLADIYITWGSYAYGRGISGESMRDEFVRRFSKVGVTVKNMPDRETDLLDIDDVYGYLGGMNSFIRAYGRADSVSYMGDGSDPDRVRTRATREELQFTFRTKVLNPKFIDGLKRHGYRGVAEVAKLTEYTFGWDATADVVDKWMYDKMADRYLFDDDTRQWMEDENPHAMMDMMERLFEAIERGMWEADQDTVDRLKDIYLELEGRIEEVNDR